MSLSVNIMGIYRNNKINTIGCYCPDNNRDFNKDEVAHIHKMYDIYFQPKIPKFKQIKITGYVDGKCKLNLVLNNVNHQTITKAINKINKAR